MLLPVQLKEQHRGYHLFLPDLKKTQPLQQGNIRVFGELKYSTVEGKLTQLPIDVQFRVLKVRWDGR